MASEGHIHLLLGRHGGEDHYLGGRYRPRNRPAPSALQLPFPLDGRTVHLFEFVEHGQSSEPVAAERIFPAITNRYQATALAFARRVVAGGGENRNLEGRDDPTVDARYSELYRQAQQADLLFFKRPSFEIYRQIHPAEVEFQRFREERMLENLHRFTTAGKNVVARFGRVHSRVRHLAARGHAVTAHIGAGPFYAEQALNRRLLFDLPADEEVWRRAWLDRLLRTAPHWRPDSGLPEPEQILALAGTRLDQVFTRVATAVEGGERLPEGAELRSLLAPPL